MRHFQVPISREEGFTELFPSDFILASLPGDRVQYCVEWEGKLHGVFSTHEAYSSNEDAWTLQYYAFICEGDATTRRGQVTRAVPTCLGCLQRPRDLWFPFFVEPYDRPEDVRKAQEKETNERRYRRGLQTRFDRIEEDEVFAPKPEVTPKVIEVVEPDDPEPEGRESKLRARVRHAQRIEAAIRERRK